MSSVSDSKLQEAFAKLPDIVRQNLDKVLFEAVTIKKRCDFKIEGFNFFEKYLPEMVKYAMATMLPALSDHSFAGLRCKLTILASDLNRDKIVCIVNVNEEYALKFNANKCSFEHESFVMDRLKEALAKDENKKFAKHICLWDGQATVPTDYGDFFCSRMPLYVESLLAHIHSEHMMEHERFVANMKVMGELFAFFHKVGIWHIDTYPRNIVLDSENNVVVIDWDQSCYTANCGNAFKAYVRMVQYESFYVCLKQWYLKYPGLDEAVFKQLMCDDFPMLTSNGNDMKFEKLEWAKLVEAKPFMKNKNFEGVQYCTMQTCNQTFAGYVAHKKNITFDMMMNDEDDFWEEFENFQNACYETVERMFEQLRYYPKKSVGTKRKLEQVSSPEY